MDFSEFVMLMSRLADQELTDEELREVFDIIDVDQDNFIRWTLSHVNHFI